MWYRSCQKPYFQPQWDRSAPRALWHHQKQQKTCSTPWLCVGASQSCFARCLRPEHSVLACLSDTSFILPTGHSLGSTKVSRAQTFPSYPSEQGEEHQQSLSLASSYTFSYGSGLVQWQLGQPAKRDSQAWNLPPGPGSSVHPPHPQLPWNLRPTSSSPATMKMGIWRGSFPEAEAKSLFIYFAIPSVNMFRTEMVGAGGVGGGEGKHSCRKKVVETNETVLVWRILHDQRRPCHRALSRCAFDIRVFLPISISRSAYLHWCHV